MADRRKRARRRPAKAAKSTRSRARVKPAKAKKSTTRARLAAAGGQPPGGTGPHLALSAADDGPNPSAKMGFADFMREVADAMISTQQSLDLQSEAYLSGGSFPRPLPTMFRLPKLTANMKFALEKKTGEKLNLLFFSATNTASALQQHSVNFDLVAIPPPPEAKLPPGVYLPLMPRIELLFDKARRLTWLRTLLTNQATTQALGLPPSADPEKLPAVLIWQFVVPVAPGSFPVLLLVGNCLKSPTSSEPRMCFCILNEDGTQVVATQALALAQVMIAESLATFLLRAGLRQTELLATATS